MFRTDPEDLENLLRNAASGELQLPDFQRAYVWGDADVRGLIASIAKGFPVGALLTLETGGEVRFKPRPVEGAAATKTPRKLLLDGQQRITSLFQSLYTRVPVRTTNAQNKIVERHYYLDMRTATDAGEDILDGIVGVPADRIRRANFDRDVTMDLSSSALEIQNRMFPLDRVFDRDVDDWWDLWRDTWGEAGNELRQKVRDILRCIQRYKMPLIELDRDNSREAVCLIFEKVNVGGKKLDAFELVTAIFAADEFDLREDWFTRRDRLFDPTDPRSELLKGRQSHHRIESTNLLQVATLLHTLDNRAKAVADGVTGRQLPQVSMKRSDLLQLPLDRYQLFGDAVEDGFRNAAQFLQSRKVFNTQDLPYPPIRVALAALFAARGNKALTASEAERVAEWFWAVSLGELYGSSTETRIARDVLEILGWLDGGPEPRTVREATFRQDRFYSLQSRLSAAYKAINALMMRDGARDFITGQTLELTTVYSSPIDIHHVFPQAWCLKQGLDARRWNSIINKTPLMAGTNRTIGGKAPSSYLASIETKQGIARAEMETILASHRISPETMYADDFDSFFEGRKAALTELVQSVLRNSILMDGSDEPEEDILEPDPEDAA